MTKSCTANDCLQVNPQPLSEFYRAEKHADGLTFYCKRCLCARAQERSKRKPKPPGYYAAKSKKYLARKKGTPEWRRQCRWRNAQRYWPGCNIKQVQRNWEQLYEAQGGVCGSCQELKELVVDHCHDTGKVRGLICSSCNLAIGHIKDDPKKALLLCRYLKRAASR